MSIRDDIIQQLKLLPSFSGGPAQTVSASNTDGIVVELELTALDTLGCALRELRINVPQLVDCEFDTLRKWAAALCARVTYLLENIGPLEFDEQQGEVLIRSTPPAHQAAGSRFYEILLQSQSNGNFRLQRFESVKGTPGRAPVDIQITLELVEKLVGDLIDTIPAP